VALFSTKKIWLSSIDDLKVIGGLIHYLFGGVSIARKEE